jgi:hypothetical protein
MRIVSPAALRSFFSPESDDALITALTLSVPAYSGNTSPDPIRICDNYTKRLAQYTTDTELVYGITYKSNDYIFLPFQFALPGDDTSGSPRASIVINDVTYLLTETIRSITGPIPVKIELVLKSLVDNDTTNSAVEPEVVFTGFYITNITYNAQQVTAELEMIDYATEPFPAYRFIPVYFPGIF